jgi:hypothetical protein
VCGYAYQRCWAQSVTDQPKGGKTSSPVAYVYVTRPTHIDGVALSPFGDMDHVRLSDSSRFVKGHATAIFGLGKNFFL